MATVRNVSTWNHKLDCNGFVHISAALASEKSYEELLNDLREQEYVFMDGNGHTSATMRIIDMAKFKLSEVPLCMTLASHGMTNIEFISYWLQSNAGAGYDAEVCCYYYKRVDG